jgi:phenylacetic acid degradation operon negative regulatory protein
MNQARLDRAVRALLARFRRQRPLRSGSLLVTILGDAIAPRGGAVTLGSLIKLAQPFGLPERLVRTSVGRLAKDGWLTSHRAGRQSEYALTKHGRQRFAEATQRIYSEPPREWDRRWTMLLLPANSADHREKIREELRWLGFGQLTAGVLAHPSRSVADTQHLLGEMGMKGRAIVLQAASAGLAQDRELISRGWDLAELARAYRRFVESFSGIRTLLSDDMQAGEEQAFVIRTLLIHEYRKIHLRDPLLPHDLLPPGWIGAHAYDLCRQLYRRVFEKAEEYLSVNAARLSAPLVALTPESTERFGIRPSIRKR